MIEQLNTMEGAASTNGGPAVQLLAEGEAQDFRSKWQRIQAGFVDEPRKAVHEADALVDSAIKRLADIFADERSKLEKEWERAITSRPKICGSLCSAIDRSSIGCFPCNLYWLAVRATGPPQFRKRRGLGTRRIKKAYDPSYRLPVASIMRGSAFRCPGGRPGYF